MMKNRSAETATIRMGRKYANTAGLNMDGLDIYGQIWRWTRMRDDLISRKAVLNILTESRVKDSILCSPAFVEMLTQRINKIPTAFDKEEVIQELKSNMESAQLAQSLVGTDLVQCGGFSYGYYNGVKDAVKIVEKGGIE